MATTRTATAPPAWPARNLASIAIGGPAYFALMVLALHFLRPDLNPIAQPASAYAIGPFSLLMTTAFFGLGLGGWALLLAIAWGVPAAWRSPAGLGLLGLWAASIWVAMLFPMDLDRAAPTLSGRIHDLSGFLGFFCLSAGAFLLSRRLTMAAAWRPMRRPMLVLAALLPAGFLATGLSYAAGLPFAGLVQRDFLAAMLTWLLLAAAGLRATAAASASLSS